MEPRVGPEATLVLASARWALSAPSRLGEGVGGRQAPLPASGLGKRHPVSDRPSHPRRAARDPHERPRSRGEILQLAFNWFLSIKLNTGNRLISAIKCLKSLTTQSIRWKKHNSVSQWIAWDSSRTLDLKTEVYGGENGDRAEGGAGRPRPPSPRRPPGQADPARAPGPAAPLLIPPGRAGRAAGGPRAVAASGVSVHRGRRQLRVRVAPLTPTRDICLHPTMSYAVGSTGLSPFLSRWRVRRGLRGSEAAGCLPGGFGLDP